MFKLKAMLAAAALAALAPMAHASSELIVNGGFESSDFSGNFLPMTSGLNGWTITGSVDLINSYWQPGAGNYSLDLNGNGVGGISQSFATTVGATYHVSFDMAGNPDGGGTDKTITVNGQSFSYDASNSSRGDMKWQSRGFNFVATSTSTTLSFAGSEQNQYWGAALDNISVTAVPEPETYAMLLAGLGLVGAIARRRKAA
jgi:choice-of-anchor C domain-containing protein